MKCCTTVVGRLYQYNGDDLLSELFCSLASIFQITSLQVNNENPFIDNFSSFLLFESWVKIKTEIKSRLHCIDIYDDECSSNVILYFRKKLSFYHKLQFFLSHIFATLCKVYCTPIISQTLLSNRTQVKKKEFFFLIFRASLKLHV